MANNESGHFKPPKQCLEYVKTTLAKWGVPVAPNAIFDVFSKASASKTCKELHEGL